MAERIQLRRTKGWRKPESVVTVARPTRWGNPFWVERHGAQWAVWSVIAGVLGRPLSLHGTRDEALDAAVALYRREVLVQAERPCNILVPTPAEIREKLRGRDLACWCPLTHSCHADVLLEVANL